MREWAKETCKESMEETYSWPNGIDVCSRCFIEIYHTRASGFRDSEACCSLVGEVLDHAAAREVAACYRRDDDLAYVSML
jgi:hypothetical protein